MHKFEKLTEEHRRAAELLLENELKPKKERRNREEIASELGIARKTLWEWRRRNSLFIEYKQHITTLALQDSQGKLARVLIDNLDATQPSTKMLELLAKMTPNALAAQQSEVNLNTDSNSQEDVLKRIQQLEEMKKDATGHE